MFFNYGYQNWTDYEVKERLRINNETSSLILERIHPYINKKPRLMMPDLMEAHS